MTCACGSERIAAVSGKTSDMCDVRVDGKIINDGYVPGGMNIGGGDYLHFEYCLDCGRIQGNFPVEDKALEE